MGLNTTQQNEMDEAKSKANALSQTIASRDTDISSLNVENSMFKQILADKAKRINQLNNRISILIKQLGSTK
jgi:FtsZ-binding cell division protein ZapB